MIQTPKERFLTDGTACKAHADIVTSPAFQAALNTALLEYSSRCATVTTPDAGHFKTQGAFEFAKVLCNLHVPRQTPTPKDLDNLS